MARTTVRPVSLDLGRRKERDDFDSDFYSPDSSLVHGLDQDVVTALQLIRRTVPAIWGGSPVFLHRQRGGDVE